MCGICGLLSAEPRQALDERVRRMSRTVAHRGPDAEGVHVDEGVALAHRRLSIIDLSDAGAQPMSLGAATVVYNGESYNFRELRGALEAAGRTFRGHSDTEVLLHAYDEWGLDGLNRLEGMFAFALWDAARQQLVLMRDRLGIKPLFYAWRGGGGIAFGSEIKAVLAAGDVDTRLDDQALSEYLWYGNAFEDRTIYRGIRAVPPGHRLIVSEGRGRLEAWWRIEAWLESAPRVTDARAAAVAVREAVDAAVARQLVSDVPVGIFLSGGVDSSSIAASAAIASGKPLASFAVGFDYERGVNELPKAARVAKHLGLDHHELSVSGASLREVIVDLVRAHDEPFADAANIPLFLLAKALNGAVKVVLQGDGGDEMFAGYRRYALLRHARPWGWWPNAVNPLLRSWGGGAGRRLARLGAAASVADPAMRMALLMTVETLNDPPSALLTPAARRSLASTDPFLVYRHCAARFDVADPVQQMLLTDITSQLPSQFLPKVDRATMAHGLESRVPLLDERVAELAVGLPSHLKVQGAQKKVVLREAMRERLPADILDGPKTGFGVPFEHWIAGPLHTLAQEAILERGFIERFGFDRARLEAALTQHATGARDRGFVLWKLLQLALWSHECLR